MRIIAGEARGRRLAAPAGRSTRPTGARVREALFSILGAPPEDLRVLDLFAGAGSLGLEALSRGAAAAVFVEQDRRALQCLRKNVADLGFTDRAEIIASDVLRIAGKVGDAPYGWIFADPPYATELASHTLELLARSSNVGPETTIVVEHDRRRPPTTPNGFEKSQSRRYGDTVITLYRRTDCDLASP